MKDSSISPSHHPLQPAEIHTDDLQALLGLLPQAMREALAQHPADNLLELIMDLGRPAQARFPAQAVNLDPTPLTEADLDLVVAAVGEFGPDNRAGIEGTLHRISAIRNRRGTIVGLTLRVGRAVYGTIDQMRAQVESGRNILLLGEPGVGKTTKLREIARVLADDFNKRVIVIDTSNEIAGDGDIPHPAIGSARRMQVAHPEAQHAVMIEAVENHMPEVIIVDEIGTAAETQAARTIAERGVQLIGTAHGTTLENLVVNPTLSDLVGGTESVILSDEEARLRRTQKTVTERKAPPTFDVVVELIDHEGLRVHEDTAQAVDSLLRGGDPGATARNSDSARGAATAPRSTAGGAREVIDMQGTVRILAYGIDRDSVERVIRDLHLDARTVKDARRADLIISLRGRGHDERLQRIVQASGLPVYQVKKPSTAQIRRLLQKLFALRLEGQDEQAQAAIAEARAASRRVLDDGVAVALDPQPSALRKLQHRVAVSYSLLAQSTGSEPRRHLVIHPN